MPLSIYFIGLERWIQIIGFVSGYLGSYLDTRRTQKRKETDNL